MNDADATAIFGAKGTAGVVVIATKKGDEGNVRVDADVSIG